MRRVMFLITLVGALVAMMALSGAAVAQSSVLDDFNLDSPPVTVLRAELTGEEEVPGPGDPDGSGSATIIVIPSTNTICYVLTAENIAPATAAHIHVGKRGEAGPVVQGLQPPTSGVSGGCTQANPELVSNLQENPENYYVNVHNADYPDGAIRGQLSE
jgi:CHRD domain